ncbi:hypothetical protein GIB67_006879 [Kingdonia uniflora]|uniref:C2 domain-containing protein n=1 Tax=Kingdonia uniflora TaxID=39325 RepID=A0A7J7L064_9MAGN|nr:hypothetical protein GIB67_006879 [Kingdonia uniflora]
MEHSYRPLEITVISAKDLKDVNLFSKMDVYSVVSIVGDARSKQRTPVDKNCGSNPNWNFTVKFTIDEAMAKQNRSILLFQIRAEGSLGDKDIGEVQVPVKELFDGFGEAKVPQFVSYQVRKSSGKAKGVLNFSYKFGEKNPTFAPAPTHFAGAAVTKLSKGDDEPVTAYPAAVGTSTSYPQQRPYPPPLPQAGQYPPEGKYPPAGYPPPQPGYGYPPQQQQGYGYPPQQQGYGYPPPQQGYGYGYPPPQQGYGYPPQKPPKKNKMGMGLGAGLLGGALGGLLIGDMISDAGDSGYDGGFDDGGGFDF